ncbi:hypothetical protein HanXRQr2_Chr01g0035901 [Helianthus annuus]|uniref:Uncharacterized protein n=1 Tax=Helianthus annuus TaxID=4232 RepID=A0A9K3JYW9_HELAN|nr:hypothetical protein HanXRQr2_Chr01g0035901 [Helianthus annuus]
MVLYGVTQCYTVFIWCYIVVVTLSEGSKSSNCNRSSTPHAGEPYPPTCCTGVFTGTISGTAAILTSAAGGNGSYVFFSLPTPEQPDPTATLIPVAKNR